MGRSIGTLININSKQSYIMSDIDIRIRRQESFIVANDGQFLGRLTLNKFNNESVSNEFCPYGSIYSSTSIFNQYSTYGSQYSALSPFSQYSTTPPRIYLRGVLWGVLTINNFSPMRKLNPYELNTWMSQNGLYD